MSSNNLGMNVEEWGEVAGKKAITDKGQGMSRGIKKNSNNHFILPVVVLNEIYICILTKSHPLHMFLSREYVFLISSHPTNLM